MLTYLFDKDVPLTPTNCQSFGEPPVPVAAPYVNLFVRLTDVCNARCPFCVAHEASGREFDVFKFLEVMQELQQKGITVKKLAITGGEPTTRHWDLLSLVSAVATKYPGVPLDLNTNGSRLLKLASPDILRYFRTIHISRHHHQDLLNAEAFGLHGSPLSWKDLEEVPYKEKVQIRCNLIRGFIDSAGKVQEFMDEMAAIGFMDFGFVGLMGLNDFCKENLVTPQEIGIDKPLPGALTLAEWDKPSGSCHCRNFLASTKYGPVKYYTRFESHPESCLASTLVYDVDHLRLGFSGPRIF